MAVTSLLEIDLRKVLNIVERMCRVKLPSKVVEVSLLPSEGILHVRFSEPKKLELGEPLHPLVHIYRDEDTNEITALEIIDLEKLLEHSHSKDVE